MSKQHFSGDKPERRNSAGSRPAGGPNGPRNYPPRPAEGSTGGGNRFGNDSPKGRDFSSRPSFGRSAGKPGEGGGFGGKRFGGNDSGPKKFGSQGGFNRPEGAGSRGSFGAGARREGSDDTRRPFNREGGNDRPSFGSRDGGNRPTRPFNREQDSRPPRSFDRDAPRRFESRGDDRRSFGDREKPRDERPARPYEPKANWPGQPYRQEGKPAVPRGDHGERNRKFKKANPFEQESGTSQPLPPTPAPAAERFERDADMGPNRAIRPARPFDFRKPPEEFTREENDRTERPERREGGFGSRSFGERPAFGNKPTGDRGTYADRNAAPRRFDDDKRGATSSREEGKPYGNERNPRISPSSDKRFATSNRADKPKRGEVAGEAPSYANLKHYEDDKTRGNKRRREEEKTDAVRLNRYIANAGICSRRDADELIAAGEIKVNGEVVTEMGYQVKPTDTVQYGKTNLNREKQVYVLLNKPKDFITTTEDPEGRKTVMDLVATASKERIFPVGRLDRNTTGLLLFTNDGEVAQKLSHPSHKNKKIYQAELNKPLTEEHLRQIAEGLELEDGKADVDDVAIVAGNAHFVGIELHLGRNRIVRRIFEHLGYEVVALDRVQYAGLTKKDLPRGKWRFLSEKEVIRLKYFM
ncbi:23S rRNA pseudouridine2605 synthase [Hymenobacter daecheongensis DSM 21074]|uniref:Pseudouridine synthase n=1 Tax=Hymenobacter daecheongensis DSM 21074 TaxID=1121955 RepID=A0A1M6B941_9BACT|nr:pseudouridine synthase [Hymenobacter daecheongensis]SHI45167.1 23S rRNA pseudouridine2605 synthase [Hymenobacter daecheongensis DSM 21074]